MDARSLSSSNELPPNTWNVLIDTDGQPWILDWAEAILAARLNLSLSAPFQ